MMMSKVMMMMTNVELGPHLFNDCDDDDDKSDDDDDKSDDDYDKSDNGFHLACLHWCVRFPQAPIGVDLHLRFFISLFVNCL